MRIKLYKTIKGKRELVDFGVLSNIDLYMRRGYDVVVTNNPVCEPVYKAPVKRKVVIRKPSIFTYVKSFVQSLVRQPAFAYSC